MTRLRRWALELLIALDQLAHVWIAGWTFVWLGRGDCPSADETISSRVGRGAAAGRRWALLVERLIDALLGAGHCRASIEPGQGDEE